MKDNGQLLLFEAPPGWRDEWKEMPDYEQKDLMPWQTVRVHFGNQEDRAAFSQLVGQTIGNRTISIWYPRPARGTRRPSSYCKSEDRVNPKYPVYIISKGRWESRLTSKALDAIGVPYHIVIEPQEYDVYAEVIDQSKILVLPFSNLGEGSIPARNWVWEHSVGIGAARHWILDDNIISFIRLNDNKKTIVTDGSTFAACEKFADRYTNVAIAGMNYHFFAKQRQLIPPFHLNTRIYSCILIKNDIPYRWRGRYNEDTDLSLRALKDGWCTVLFNAFLADKSATMTVKGGNTDDLYQGDGRLRMAQSLQEQHPGIVTITKKWGRWQHQVNYAPFRMNKLIGVHAQDDEYEEMSNAS